MDNFPFEVLVTVLMLLPAEDLVSSCMLVCKKWHDLIKDAHFILKHLQASASRGNNYLLCGPRDYLALKSFKLLSDNSHVKVLEREIQYDFHTDICKPIYTSGGLILLSDTYKLGTFLYLYNPFIQKSKYISSTSFKMEEEYGKVFGCRVLGFGYHSQANDYKIVRIAFIKYYNDLREVIRYGNGIEIYSVSKNSWRRIKETYIPRYHTRLFVHFDEVSSAQVIFHDCFHWLASSEYSDGEESRLLAFDMGKEEFQAIKMPSYGIDEYDHDKVVTYKGNLSLIVFYRDGLKFCCSLWELTEYGESDSWRHLFNIVMDEKIERRFTFTKHDEDELIFRDQQDRYVVHNLFTQKRQYLEGIETFGLSEVLPLTNSLTLIDSKNDA